LVCIAESSHFETRVAGRRFAGLVDPLEISPKLFPVQLAAAFKLVTRRADHAAADALLFGFVRRDDCFLAPAMPRRRH
jgi:hypothetical protein